MKKYLYMIYIGLYSVIISTTYAKNVATVEMMRGSAQQTSASGTSTPLKVGDTLQEGTKITTGAKSFVKLSFIDDSKVNVGPESEMSITEYKANQPGLITLVKGQLRSQVKKEENQTGEKLIVKTKNVAMGVRGTEFQATFNPENNQTALITFEGAVAVGTIDPNISVSDTFKSVTTVTVNPGQFTAVAPNTPPLIPTKLNPVQFNALSENKTFSESKPNAEPINNNYRSPLPPGAPVSEVTNDNKALDATLNVNRNIASTDFTDNPPPQGMRNEVTGQIALPAGTMIDLSTGLPLAPPPGSTFDPNTNTFVPPPQLGAIDPSTGQYQAPTLKDENGNFVPLQLKPNGEFQASLAAPTAQSPSSSLNTTLTQMNQITAVSTQNFNPSNMMQTMQVLGQGQNGGMLAQMLPPPGTPATQAPPPIEVEIPNIPLPPPPPPIAGDTAPVNIFIQL